MALFAPITEVFPGIYKDRGSEMIKVDLEKAGIPFEDDCGQRIDFHSLRHTCGTRMARNGVPLAVAQKIMRHSTPVLTSGYYTHILVADKARELARLPALIPSDPQKNIAVKTGTDDMPEPTESADRKMDRNGDDSNRQITTYNDSQSMKKGASGDAPDIPKTLVAQ